jgi:uncharacterized protein YecE (DUF72 family)
MKSGNEIRIGISGWNYPLWRRTFYPEKVSVKRELEYAADRVSTIEVNGSFYRLQKPATFRDWYERTPGGLVFSIKGNRYITHAKRLKDVGGALANFFATGPLELREKLGPILWQFPPHMKFNADRFKEFFGRLPRTPRDAIKLARNHDMKLSGDDERLVAHTKAKLRYAVEIRDDSFKCDEFVDLLREYEIAYVIADTADRWVYAENLTADFVYVRLHGYKELYSGGYTPEAIEMWAEKIAKWTKDRPGFVYFDNDAKVNAPFDAASLMLELNGTGRVVMPAVDPRQLLEQRAHLSKKTLRALQARAVGRKVTRRSSGRTRTSQALKPV